MRAPGATLLGFALFLLVAVAGCGSAAAGRRGPIAQRVCSRAGRAVARAQPALTVRIVSSQTADIVCRMADAAVVLRLEAQATSRAWEEYDTTVVHLQQAFMGGSVHQQRYLPEDVGGVGLMAVWVPAQHELVTTNGTQSSGGSYLTVTVAGRGSRAPSGRRLAILAARAAIALAPRGPSPGPPPS